MKNFTAYNPVKIHFGKNCTDELGQTAAQYGKKVLLIYGKSSVKHFGYYDIIKNQLEKAGMQIAEYGGIKPNPVCTQADEAIELGIKNKSDLLVALGGGSVIDTAKYVALGIKSNLKAWDIAKAKKQADKAAPLIAILTVAATGTEMNQFAVIQNDDTKEKIGFGSELMYPMHSFLDPQFTYSLPKSHTAYGVVDIIAHSFENFFGSGTAPLSDRITASIIAEAMFYGPKVLEEPENYDYRANIMHSATMALNGITAWGKNGGDWGVHSIGHNLSVIYDIPHGASLSIAYPAWFRHIRITKPDRLSELSNLLFGEYDADRLIIEIENFFKIMNAPVRLSEVNIAEDQKQSIIDLMKANKVSGTNYPLSESDYEPITNLMFGY